MIIFLENTNDSKRVWKGIKQIIHFTSNNKPKSIKIIEDSTEITDPLMIANAFNNYFANVGKNLAKLIPHIEKSHSDYLKSPLPDSFFNYPVTTFEMESEMSKLKNGKAIGPFSIPVSIMKRIKTIIAEPLAILFNISFTTGIVTSSFKLAKVSPIYKKDLKTSLTNYRPISLLSIFDKLLEKLMCNRILDFLGGKQILFDKQFGFRAKYSNDYAILSIVDKIQRAIDERDFSCGIFLDFSKAFDKVDHEILI